MEIAQITILLLFLSVLIYLVALIRKLHAGFELMNTKISTIEKSEEVKKLNENLKVLKTNNLQEWLDAINAHTEKEESSLEFLEATSRRFPKNRKIIEDIRGVLSPLASKGENLIVRREALVRLREHANRFLNNCNVEDFEYALEFRNDVIESTERIVNEIDNLRESNLQEQLKVLERKVAQLKQKPKNEDLLKEIEQIDQQIDQNELQGFSDLKSKYEDLSKVLIGTLEDTEQEGKAKLKKLNEKAIEDAKKVHTLIENHSEGGIKDKFTGPSKPVNYNEKNNLQKLIKLISGHDHNKLLPSTSNYLRTVEGEVFGKLSSKGKVLFTELMVKESFK